MKWEPIEKLEKAYYINIISDTIEKFEMTLTNYAVNKKVLVTFENSVDAYRRTDESFRLTTMTKLDQAYGENFYGELTFFKVENSRYIQWLKEEAPEIFIPKDYMHFSFISAESFVDIVTTYEPIVGHLENN